MLVLSRKIGQEIIIGQNIRVLISQVRGKQVRLAIAAPAAIQVQREEVRRRAQKSEPTAPIPPSVCRKEA